MQSLPDTCHNTLENQISSLHLGSVIPSHSPGGHYSQTDASTPNTLHIQRAHLPTPPHLTSTAQHGKDPAGWLEPRGGAHRAGTNYHQGWQSLQFDRWCGYLLTTKGPSTCWQCAEHLQPKEDTVTQSWLQQSLDAFLYHCAHKVTFNHRFSLWRSPLTENVDYTAREMQFRRTEQLRQRRQGSSSTSRESSA